MSRVTRLLSFVGTVSNGIISLFFPGIDDLSIEVFHIADSEEPGCARSPLEIYRIATLTTSHWEAYTTVSRYFGGICPNSVQNISRSERRSFALIAAPFTARRS